MINRLLALAGFAVATTLVIVGLKRYDAGGGVTPSPAVRIVTDLTHDADRVGLALTRVSIAEEEQVGNDIARSLSESLSERDLRIEAYLDGIGNRLAVLVVRKGIPYRVHYVPDPDLVNAFAVPGGHVYVGKGLLDLLESEAELAAVLAHEIQHVDQRHAIERFQYELAARHLGLGEHGVLLAKAGAALFQAGYQKDQELDADRLGVTMCAQIGYDPSAFARVFQRMQARFAQFEAPRRRRGPVRETAHVLAASLEEYFRSHPRYEERIAQIRRLSASYPKRNWVENRSEFLRQCRPRLSE